jgi:hypothetical protein
MLWGAAIASARADNAHSDRFATVAVIVAGIATVSTRTYIVLAALTGLVILVAFALQVVLVNK